MEHQARSYGDWLENRLAVIHPLVTLPGLDQRASLDHFVTGYIEMAPRMLQWLHEWASVSGLAPLFAEFLDTSVSYFTTPRLPLIQHTGMEGLLVKAYQAQRLLEELLDHNPGLARQTNCFNEITHANLLAHHLIGEPFGNELDQDCEQTLPSVVDLPKLQGVNLARHLNQSTLAPIEALRQGWLSLLQDNHIAFGIRTQIPGLTP